MQIVSVEWVDNAHFDWRVDVDIVSTLDNPTSFLIAGNPPDDIAMQTARTIRGSYGSSAPIGHFQPYSLTSANWNANVTCVAASKMQQNFAGTTT